MVATGIVYTYMVKGGKELKDPVHGMWMHAFELKFLLSAFLTPMVYPMTGMFAAEGEINLPDETIRKF